MTTLVYDGTFEGLLTSVYDIYELKLVCASVQQKIHHHDILFGEMINVATDNDKFKRVLKGLKQKLSLSGIQRLYIAQLSGMENIELTLIGYIRYVFDTEQNIEEDYGNKYVYKLSEVVQKMRREKHRMEAFIRFQKLNDGTFYAAIEPDFNVLPLILKHFKNRYADQKWIIYDLKRKYCIYYDLNDAQYMEPDISASTNAKDIITLHCDDESIYQHLWKNYFSSVNIASRKNKKLHLRHIPKRYWRHLTEKF